MTTKEILQEIIENGGFDWNLNKWSIKEIKRWIKSCYQCSDYVGQKVATTLFLYRDSR